MLACFGGKNEYDEWKMTDGPSFQRSAWERGDEESLQLF